MDGTQISGAVQHCLQEFQIFTGSGRHRAFHHDRVASNTVAYNILAMAGPKLRDAPCWSHTGDHVWGYLEIKDALEFNQLWRAFFGKSDNLRLLWRRAGGEKLVFSSETRWWSEHDSQMAALLILDDPNTDASMFVAAAEASGRAKETAGKLQSYFQDSSKMGAVRLQMCLGKDVGLIFCTLTYFLEGDGPVVLFANEKLVEADNFVAQQDDLPFSKAEIMKQTSDARTRNTMFEDLLARVKPAYDYWKLKNAEPEMVLSRAMFKAAACFNPYHIKALGRDNVPDSLLDMLSAFNESKAHMADSQIHVSVDEWFTSANIGSLKAEWPAYVDLCCQWQDPEVDVDDTPQKKFEVRGVAVLKFWRGNTSVIPELSDACSQILLLKPSSATNERIFSLLMRFFGPMSGRSRTLVDVIMLTLMYRFNDPTRSIWESWPDQD